MPSGIRLRTRARYRALLPRQGLLPKQCFGRSPRPGIMHVTRRGRLDAIAKYTEYKRQFVRRVYFALIRRGLKFSGFCYFFLSIPDGFSPEDKKQERGTLLSITARKITIESSPVSPSHPGI